MTNVDNLFVHINASLKDAFKSLDKGGIGLILVLDDEESFHGIMTDGDFRRAILSGVSLKAKVGDICNTAYSFLLFPYKETQITQMFKNPKIRHLPIVQNGKVVDVVVRDHYYAVEERIINALIDTPVVIMAGGKGSRLDPFTRILPKPLLPVGNKTILETIIDKFLPHQIGHFYLTVNYKSIVIKSYFDDLNPPYSLTYIEEDIPLGTAGALKFLESKVTKPFILTNCDILIDADYSDLVDYHNKEKNDITIVASLKHYNIHYGICEIENGG